MALTPLPSVSHDPFYFSVHLLCLCGSMQQSFLHQSCVCFPSPPTPLSKRSFFIHSYFTASTATELSHPAQALPHYNRSLSASICIPLALFPPRILLLSHPLLPCTPPFLCVGAFLSLFFSSLMCASLLSLYSSPSLSLIRFFQFPPQSLLMRCDKPCYHSNRLA